MIGAVLFDMDGVLADSEPVITEAAVRCLKRWGIDAQHSDFLPFTGMGEVKFIGGVSEKYGVPYTPEMLDCTYDIYDTLASEVKVFEGAALAIAAAKARGMKVAVCSSAHLRKVRVNLEAMGLSPESFHAVIAAEQVINKKPDPEIFLKGAAAVGVPVENCLVVEDALSGIQAGKAAGCKVLGVPTSFSPEKLLGAGADAVLSNIGALAALL